jgi:hypothetical protein
MTSFLLEEVIAIFHGQIDHLKKSKVIQRIIYTVVQQCYFVISVLKLVSYSCKIYLRTMFQP